MVRKIIHVSTLVLMLLFICSNEVYANNDNSSYNFNLEEELDIPDEYTNLVKVSSNISIFTSSSTFTLVINNNELIINDTYINYILQKDMIYIITRNNLYIINIKLFSYTKYEINMIIEDFVYDDYIYLVGNKNNNPCICILDERGNILKENVIVGDGFATYKSIEKVNDLFLITCYKDAFFKCDEFYCVGNIEQMKSLVLTIDKALDIQSIYYFNEGSMVESINSVCVMNNILVILETDAKDYLYEFDFDLNLVSKEDVTKKGYNVFIIKNKLNSKLLLYKKDNSFFLYLDNNKIFELNKHLVSFYEYEKGIAFIYDNKLNIFSEYHIDKLNTLYLDKINYDYLKTNDIIISSFFENVDISIFKSEPYFRTQMSGKFNVTYEIKNTFGSTYFIKRDVIVRNFVNIVDKGIYNTNTKLSFFGDAYLNDEYITNGYSLKEEGEYILKLYDINGFEKIYTFEVVSDYYKDNDNYVIDTDYVLRKKDVINVEFDFISDDVLYFIVNNEKYYDFIIEENRAILNINTSDKWGYEKFDISKVVTSNKEISINKEFTVLTLKDKPEISLSSKKENDKYIISLDIKDFDNAIIDISFESSNQKNMYMKNSDGVLDSGIFYVKYELGDGCVHSEELFFVKGDNVKYFVEIDENKVNIILEDESNLEEVIINNENIYLKESDDINLIIIIASICLTVLVCCFYLGYFLKNRLKRKNINRI